MINYLGSKVHKIVRTWQEVVRDRQYQIGATACNRSICLIEGNNLSWADDWKDTTCLRCLKRKPKGATHDAS